MININFIDKFLNDITMYRLILYYLIGLLLVAVFESFFSLLPLDPFALTGSAIFLMAVCWLTNKIFAKVFEVPVNVESSLITGLILALIISPFRSFSDLAFLGWAAVLSQSAKYILAVNKKHIFNPAALAVVLTWFVLGDSASWWVGNLSMLPFVLIGGILVVRKIRRFDLVFYFFLVAVLMSVGLSAFAGHDPFNILKQEVIDSPLFFFAFVMLTEPLTTPPTQKLQQYYGAVVGFLFAPQIHLGSLYTTPELALVLGNVFSFIVSPKDRLMLTLRQRIQLTPQIFDFVFQPNKRITYTPGQYLEWTLGHENPDARGNRRYFTIASSPTESEIHVGVRFPEKSSSFKKTLLKMPQGGQIFASQLSGDFTLPSDVKGKYVFIAGGIGITPFRSMIKYLLDKRERRDIILLYANRTAEEIVYKDILDQAKKNLGLKVVYNLTDSASVPANWSGKKGRIDEQEIRQEIPDFKERIFYISGPLSMITSFKSVLEKLGVPLNQIKTDYFPGFA